MIQVKMTTIISSSCSISIHIETDLGSWQYVSQRINQFLKIPINTLIFRNKHFTWFLDNVGDATGSVLAVLKGDFCFAGALDSNRQTSSTSLTSPDAEFSCTTRKLII